MIITFCYDLHLPSIFPSFLLFAITLCVSVFEQEHAGLYWASYCQFLKIYFIFEAENVRTDLLYTFQLICNANHILTCFHQNLYVREHNVKTKVHLTDVQGYQETLTYVWSSVL